MLPGVPLVCISVENFLPAQGIYDLHMFFYVYGFLWEVHIYDEWLPAAGLFYAKISLAFWKTWWKALGA